MLPVVESIEIIRTERGLTVSGTRVALCDVMDLMKADYPPALMCDQLNLTAVQVDAALAYIQANRAAMEAEYQTALQTREEIYTYWAEQNRDRFEQIAARPVRSDYADVRAKLRLRKEQRVVGGE
jgi:uncharacterized protein (DUF433 family)